MRVHQQNFPDRRQRGGQGNKPVPHLCRSQANGANYTPHVQRGCYIFSRGRVETVEVKTNIEIAIPERIINKERQLARVLAAQLRLAHILRPAH